MPAQHPEHFRTCTFDDSNACEQSRPYASVTASAARSDPARGLVPNRGAVACCLARAGAGGRAAAAGRRCRRHLAGLHLGAKTIPRERRRAKRSGERLLALIDAVQEAALAGLKEHDRLVMAKGQMERRPRPRRASSKLPELVELVLSRRSLRPA
ncbi:DUF1612 domain-containing protein [Mesorhizobium sp. B2-4-19]|uniref:DUF1612 domain-containing protein n=1 Tax=Mesorhizobium sp. B2-4-19 TaxID=2589930 RepID=UPI001FEE2E0D|nr:DUF1612 domain-containing protein [Mesorhizobium sp. B2-4-19]